MGYLDENRVLAKKVAGLRYDSQCDVASRRTWGELATHVNAFGTNDKNQNRSSEQWLRTWTDLYNRGVLACEKVINGSVHKEPFYHLRYAYNIAVDQHNPPINVATKEFILRPLASTPAAGTNINRKLPSWRQPGPSNDWYAQRPTHQAPSSAYPYNRPPTSTSNNIPDNIKTAGK